VAFSRTDFTEDLRKIAKGAEINADLLAFIQASTQRDHETEGP
jgi:hypothetical protein